MILVLKGIVCPEAGGGRSGKNPESRSQNPGVKRRSKAFTQSYADEARW
jgi:hypothetical protein